MSNKNDTFSDNSYSSDEFIDDNENLIKKSNESKNYIQKYIIIKLLHFYNFNEKLMALIKRKYKNINFKNSNYFEEYYIINSNWIKNYLQFYNYKKISLLIKKKSNGKFDIDNFCNKIKRKSIKEVQGENNEKKDHLSSIEFAPIKENIPRNIYFQDISDKTIEYFNNFIIVDKELYDELRQDNGNVDYPYYQFAFENKINICLVDNLFIYKIKKNILGIGILPEFLDNNEMLVFKIHFLLILFYDYKAEKDYQYNSDTEIRQLFKSGDLETYLVIDRGIRFENEDQFRKIGMKIAKKEIGLLYNSGNFKKEIYWERTKEEFQKKNKEREQMKIIKGLLEIETSKEKQENMRLQKLKEKEEDKNIEELEMRINQKKEKEKIELKLKAEEIEKKILIDLEKSKNNEIFKQKLKSKKLNGISNGEDKINNRNDAKFNFIPHKTSDLFINNTNKNEEKKNSKNSLNEQKDLIKNNNENSDNQKNDNKFNINQNRKIIDNKNNVKINQFIQNINNYKNQINNKEMKKYIEQKGKNKLARIKMINNKKEQYQEVLKRGEEIKRKKQEELQKEFKKKQNID